MSPTLVSAEFGELEGLSDALILGCPTLGEWGFGVDKDDDGHYWVQFRRLGLRCPMEMPDAQAVEPSWPGNPRPAY